jgi:hypothetical protein
MEDKERNLIISTYKISGESKFKLITEYAQKQILFLIPKRQKNPS